MNLFITYFYKNMANFFVDDSSKSGLVKCPCAELNGTCKLFETSIYNSSTFALQCPLLINLYGI